MTDINVSFLIGRLTADPQETATKDGTSVCRFSVATNYYAGKGKEDGVSFIRCTAWGKLAEIVAQYGRKGMRVAVKGELRQHNYTDKSGVKREDVGINVDQFQMVDGKKKDEATDEYSPSEAPMKKPAAPAGELGLNDEVPF